MVQLIKPVILIGLLHEEKIYKRLAEEVGWGVEEEGCMYEVYLMETREDIRYSLTEASVIIDETAGHLYVRAMEGDYCMQKITGTDIKEYRLLGKNAARYLKKKYLLITGGDE